MFQYFMSREDHGGYPPDVLTEEFRKAKDNLIKRQNMNAPIIPEKINQTNELLKAILKELQVLNVQMLKR